MLIRNLLLSALLLMSTSLYSAASANELGDVTPEVLLQDALSLSCIDYRISGICFWLKCSWSGCRVVSSPQVEHYNPDVVMEVTNNDRRPIQWLTGPINKVSEGLASKLFNLSTGHRGNNQTHDHSYQFHDVNAVGNPILPIFNQSVGTVASLVHWCGSQTVPFQPYFSSKVDPDWRLGVAEALLTIPNLHKQVGTASDHWASLYPRTGALVQPDLYRASAGIAFRAGHITTRASQPHVYTRLPTGSTGGKTWSPGELEPGNKDSGKWQLNYPRAKQGCYVFPEPGTTTKTIPSEVENYVWTLWRKYKCCSRRGRFIEAVEW